MVKMKKKTSTEEPTNHPSNSSINHKLRNLKISLSKNMLGDKHSSCFTVRVATLEPR
jgi:hypothetical protein